MGKPTQHPNSFRCLGMPDNESYLGAGYLLAEYIGFKRRTRGTETSKYPKEKKSIEIPLVAASERGLALKLIWC